MNKVIKKTTIITGYDCNNRCRFCIYSDKRTINAKSTQQIIKEMRQARGRNSKYLVLVGGEPFIRKDILQLIETARRLGFSEVVAATNGRMFAYRDFAKKVIDAGITQIYFSIHGHNARLHDSLTRSPGSFNELIAGISNIKSLGLKNFGSHTTITKPNYKYLVEIAKLIYRLGIKSADFVFVDANYGGAHEDFEELVPRISDVFPYMRKNLDFAARHPVEHWAVRYIPVCCLKDYGHYVSDINDLGMVHTEHVGPDFKDSYVEKTRRDLFRTKTARCLGCRYYKKCEGLWKEYVKHFGDAELKAVPK